MNQQLASAWQHADAGVNKVNGGSRRAAMNLAMLLTFRTIGFGWNGQGFLLTSPEQSHKLTAV